MNKKKIAYILIGVSVFGVIIYLVQKFMKGSIGSGVPDNRGAWAAEDDALYRSFRNQFLTDALWLDPIADQFYKGAAGDQGDTIGGINTKSGSFARAVYNSAPNDTGKYGSVHWDTTKPSLWPPEKVYKLSQDFNSFKVKYSGL